MEIKTELPDDGTNFFVEGQGFFDAIHLKEEPKDDEEFLLKVAESIKINMKGENPIETKVRMESTSYSLKDGIYFQCDSCNIRIKLAKDNVEQIVDHLTSPERFNQILIHDSHFSELTVHLSLKLLVSRFNSNVALVKLRVYFKCSKCGLAFPSRLSYFEAISNHISSCHQTIEANECMACRKKFCSNIPKEHFDVSSPLLCRKSSAYLLQSQIPYCRTYMDLFKPLCIICLNHHWPYLGQHSHMKPICEDCRVNLLAKSKCPTSKIPATCAACTTNCSEEFITSEPRRNECLYIGVKCFENLKRPLSNSSKSGIEIVKDKISKVIYLLVNEVQIPQLFEDKVTSLQNKGIHHLFNRLNRINKILTSDVQ